MSLAAALAVAVDPVELARRASLEPDPWQADVLRGADPRALLLCSRQSGKSTTTAVAAVHRAAFWPGSTVLLLSPTQRQSGELLHRVRAIYGAAGLDVNAKQESATILALGNGSRIISLPGTEATVRGYTADLLIVDEAARVPDGLYAAVRPMLAVTGGRLIALSTPYGKRGWLHAAWTGGEPWARTKVTATDCPRISEEFLRDELAAVGQWAFAQEYACEFLDAETAVFRESDVAAAFDDDPDQWDL